MAAEAGQDPEQFAGDLLTYYAGQDLQFRASVRRGLEQAERGEFIEQDEMDARVARWLRT